MNETVIDKDFFFFSFSLVHQNEVNPQERKLDTISNLLIMEYTKIVCCN